MKKFEITIAVIALIALGLKLLQIPGAGLLITVSLMTYNVAYSFLGFVILNKIRIIDILKKDSYNEISHLRIVGSVYLGWALGITIYGVLFKIMLWKGADTMLLTGISSLLVFAIVAIVKYVKTRSQFYVGVLTRIAIVGGLGLISYFLF